jgi:hypothetical protein
MVVVCSVLKFPLSLRLSVHHVIPEVSEVRVDIGICKHCILFVLIIRLDINVIMVFFSMGDLDEIFARITFVRGNIG